MDDRSRLGHVEEVRIGSRDDPDAGFSRIGDLEVAVDGTLYVLETMAREVRVFSPEGGKPRTVGGPGEGPGEFARPRSIGLLGDTLWVLDGMGQAYGVSDAALRAAMASVLDLPGHRPPLRSALAAATGASGSR